MSTETIVIIVILVILFGGGGCLVSVNIKRALRVRWLTGLSRNDLRKSVEKLAKLSGPSMNDPHDPPPAPPGSLNCRSSFTTAPSRA
jgi:hypothetical protein